mgnify:CR=1 FL=1
MECVDHDNYRPAVREALRRLATEGLVVVTPNQGAQVAVLGSAELEEIYALRAMLAAAAAAQRAGRRQSQPGAARRVPGSKRASRWGNGVPE